MPTIQAHKLSGDFNTALYQSGKRPMYWKAALYRESR